MRLFLAVAVLMLALIAYTEAQEDTIEAKFATFTDQMSEAGRNLAEKAKNTLETIKNSDFATNAMTWFQEQMEKAKGSLNK